MLGGRDAVVWQVIVGDELAHHGLESMVLLAGPNDLSKNGGSALSNANAEDCRRVYMDADSDRPEVAFVFEGVLLRNFGEQGTIGGGCADIEVDRSDVFPVPTGQDMCWRVLSPLIGPTWWPTRKCWCRDRPSLPSSRRLCAPT